LDLESIINDPALLEIGRQAVEKALKEFRDDRISMPRGNGLVIREKDGSPSSIIRFGPEHCLKIGLTAITEHLKDARTGRGRNE